MHEGSITFKFVAEVKEIERLNRLIRQFGELHEIPSRALYALNLALDEVVTNVVLYAYEGQAPGEVEVEVRVAGKELSAQVRDAGREFNPLEVSPPDLDAPLQERELGGLGIHLVRSLMEGLEYRREAEKNVLTMLKRIR